MVGQGGKSNGGESPAKGWDLWKLKLIAEPPEALSATIYVLVAIIFLAVLASGVVALFELLAPIWGLGGLDNRLLAPGVDPGAEQRGRLLIIGALLTTPFLIWRLVVSHWAARAAQEQVRVAQETARNALYTKAVEQLGAMREVMEATESKNKFGIVTDTSEKPVVRPNTEVRLGAIYALEKLARDDLSMHWPIMETLCAYIRENGGRPRTPSDEIQEIFGKPFLDRSTDEDIAMSEYDKTLVAPSVDVQAAISVVGRRTKTQREYERIRRKNASSRAKATWRLDLSGCHLALANFNGLDFASARFDGSTLQYARFRGARLGSASFIDSNLESAELNDAQLVGANLYAVCLQSASLDGASLDFASLLDARCESASLRNVRLQGAILQGANFGDTSLSGALLDDALCDRANFRNAKEVVQAQLDLVWGNEKT